MYDYWGNDIVMNSCTTTAQKHGQSIILLKSKDESDLKYTFTFMSIVFYLIKTPTASGKTLYLHTDIMVAQIYLN